MNEELKIIITAATDGAKKSIQGVKKELGGVTGSAKGASKGIGAAMKGVAAGAAIAVAAIVAVGAALVKLGKASLDFQKAQAKLNTAFLSMGSTAQQAAESYNGLFRFLGDQDTSVEAAAHLAKLTTNQKELAEWTKICQGIYATFGDSLKIEGLTEAANETARVGKVTGTMADALNWAGVSEDEFNAKLAKTTSYSEREALIRSTLNGLYSDAAEIYERNNKALLEHNESQARLDASMARAGQSVTPLLTALNNLSAVLFDALAPAIEVISNALATFVGWITQGIQAVMGLFGAVTGASTSITSMANAGAGIGSAANGANALAGGLNDAAAAAEKAKKATMGFDELNVVGSGSSGGAGGSGSGTPGYMAPQVGAQNFTMEVEQTEKKASGLAETMKKIGAELKDVFAPTISAWTEGFETIKQAWNDSKDNFERGGKDILSSLESITKYAVGDFVPSLVNSFSENLAPVITDVLGFAIEETGKNFETFGYITKDATENLVIPAIDTLKNAYMDMMETVGNVWDEKGQPLLDKWTQAMDHVRSTFVGLYEEFIKPIVEKITKTFEKLWNEHLQPLWEKIVSAVMTVADCLLKLYNEFLAPIIDWIRKNIVPVIKKWLEGLIEHLGEVIGYIADAIGGVITVFEGLVNFITGVFTGDWEQAWEGIKQIFSGIWEVICGIALAAWETIKYPFTQAGEFFSGVWNKIKEIFSGVKEWFSEKFTAAWSGIKSAWSGAKSWFGDVWEGIKKPFKDVAGWFKEKFTAAWTAVKNVFSSGGKIFDGIKEGILSGLKTVINKIIDGINKVIAVPFKGINSALSKIKGVEILGYKPFDWVKTFTIPQIPKLARGGIVDHATLAMIGERGKEAVVPLENNTEWIDKLAAKLASVGNTPSKIVLMLDGKELGWGTINSINNITRQTGALQLVMA